MPLAPHRIVIFAFDDAQILDVTGPHEVFGRTARWLDEHGPRRRRSYTVEVVSTRAGPLRTSSGLVIHAERGFRSVRSGVDTLLVAGGLGVSALLGDAAVLRWLRAMARSVRRLGSVCTGAFLLAEAGLLDGLRATTHWSACARLAADYPNVRVDPDPIFVREGRIATSAGVTAGMDLALSMVEEDHGRQVALHIARELVLFLRRPGGQSQFSAQLAAQLAGREPLKELQTYVIEHPEQELSVDQLAHRAAMSPRNFARVFSREVGVTPARFVESARIERARSLLEETTRGLEDVAVACGFGSAESMRRAFVRAIHTTPRAYRERWRAQKGA